MHASNLPIGRMEELAFLSKPMKTMPYLEELHHTRVEVTGFGTPL